VADLIDVELVPSMRCATLTVTAKLKTEQALNITSSPVVVRLDDSGASGVGDELDEILVADSVHEIVIHLRSSVRVPTGRARVLCYSVYTSLYTSTDDYNPFSADRQRHQRPT
jgi:hypothetical protein